MIAMQPLYTGVCLVLVVSVVYSALVLVTETLRSKSVRTMKSTVVNFVDTVETTVFEDTFTTVQARYAYCEYCVNGMKYLSRIRVPKTRKPASTIDVCYKVADPGTASYAARKNLHMFLYLTCIAVIITYSVVIAM